MIGIRRRLWSLILPLLVFLSFELILTRPSAVFFVAPLFVLIIFGAIFLTLGRGLKTPSSRWNFWLAPAIFYLSSLSLFFLLEKFWTRHFLAAAAAILIGFFFEGVYIYIWEHDVYEAYSLENLSNYLNSLSIFFLSSSLFALINFVQLSIWLAAIPALLVYFFLSWQTFWMSKIPWPISRHFIFLLTLVFLEIFFVLSFLPLHFLILGAVLTIVWYTFINLCRAQLLGFWSKKLWLRYLIIFLFLTGILFTTARWI